MFIPFQAVGKVASSFFTTCMPELYVQRFLGRSNFFWEGGITYGFASSSGYWAASSAGFSVVVNVDVGTVFTLTVACHMMQLAAAWEHKERKCKCEPSPRTVRLGLPVVPVYPFLREGSRSPTKIDYRTKGYPYSNLSTGAPARVVDYLFGVA